MSSIISPETVQAAGNEIANYLLRFVVASAPRKRIKVVSTTDPNYFEADFLGIIRITWGSRTEFIIEGNEKFCDEALKLLKEEVAQACGQIKSIEGSR